MALLVVGKVEKEFDAARAVAVLLRLEMTDRSVAITLDRLVVERFVRKTFGA